VICFNISLETDTIVRPTEMADGEYPSDMVLPKDISIDL